MKRYIVILSAVIMTACNYEIELPVAVKESKLFIAAFPVSDSDTTYFDIYATRPANRPKDGKSTVPNIKSIELTANGNKCEIGQKDGKYFSPHRFSKGDKISLSVQAENYPAVTSSVVMPDGPDFILERKLTDNGVEHRLVFPAASNSRDYHYGIRITQRTNYEEVSWESGSPVRKNRQEYEVLIPRILYSSSSDKNEIPGYRSIAEEKIGGVHTVVMENSAGVDNEIILSIWSGADKYVYTTQTDTLTRRSHYNIEALRIDGPTYDYLNPKINYYLMSAGLVPPFTNTGNILGGYGCFGPIGSASTGWLENIVSDID